jgi:RNA polymerase sigma factor (sigma-70 family)
MNKRPILNVLDKLRQFAIAQQLDKLSDRELLQRFAQLGDQDAYGEVLRRHSGLVMATCRHWLPNEQDAEDAFQAVFLILARKAGALCWRESVAGWLHRTALLVSRKQARADHVRRCRERQVVAERSPNQSTPGDLAELQRLLDEELQRLPEQFRSPILLCCLAELSQEEAACRLGLSETALRGRLWRGRELLRNRLARRGLQSGAVLLAGTLAQQTALAAFTAPLVRSTIQAGIAYAAGLATGSLVSQQVLHIARGGLHTMLLHQLQKAALAALAVGLLTVTGLASPLLLGPASDSPAVQPPQISKTTSRRYRSPEQTGLTGTLHALDVSQRRITVQLRDQPVKLRLDLARDARVFFSDDPGQLSDLKPGSELVLTLADDDRTVTTVQVWGEDSTGLEFRSVNLNNQTIEAVNEDQESVTMPIRKSTLVVIDGYLDDWKNLEPGMKFSCLYARDNKTIARLFATWLREGDLSGRIKSVDAGTGEVVLHEVAQAEDEAEKRCSLARDTRILLDGQPAKVSDLKPGLKVFARLEAGNFMTITALRAFREE